jgi:anti-sigma factor RsiW
MKHDDQILSRYYDGELNDSERAQVEAQLESNPESAKAIRNMKTMSELFRTMQAQHLEDISFDGLDKRVLNEIHRNPSPISTGERIRVWFSEFFAHRKAVWIPAVSMAGAACVALLAVGLNPGQSQMPAMPSQNAPSTWTASGSTDAVAATLTVSAPDEMTVQKYSLETETGQRIAVVWINE